MRLYLGQLSLIGCLLFASASFCLADGMEPGVPTNSNSSEVTHVRPHKSTAHKAPVRKNSSASASSKTNTKPLDDFELAKYQYCGQDSDCAIAINGCCDCANGGKEVSVNKERLEEFKNRFACLHVQCGTKAAEPLCANGVVTCISHRCVYYDERPSTQF